MSFVQHQQYDVHLKARQSKHFVSFLYIEIIVYELFYVFELGGKQELFANFSYGT